MVPFTWRFFVTFLGWLSDPFKGLNDLQLGDEKVTLNHLAPVKFSGVSFFAFCNQITRRFFFFMWKTVDSEATIQDVLWDEGYIYIYIL